MHYSEVPQGSDHPKPYRPCNPLLPDHCDAGPDPCNPGHRALRHSLLPRSGRRYSRRRGIRNIDSECLMEIPKFTSLAHDKYSKSSMKRTEEESRCVLHRDFFFQQYYFSVRLLSYRRLICPFFLLIQGLGRGLIFYPLVKP